MKEANITKMKRVVFYDNADGKFAARAAFMLKYYGHPYVHVLEGGFKKWVKDGKPVSSDEPENLSRAYADNEFDYVAKQDMIRSFEEMQGFSESHEAQIIDVRPAAVFEKGSIPSALNIPAFSFFNEDGSIKTKEEVAKIFTTTGVDTSKPIVFSCQSGVQASIGFLAAEYLRSNAQISLYDGSWAEYSKRM